LTRREATDTPTTMSFASPSQQQSYRRDGYVALPRLFPPAVLAIFHGRMQQVLDLKNAPEFRSQSWLVTKPVIEVYSMRYAPMTAFHWGLTPVASELAGCELLPTYAYFRVYQKGDICVVHADRPACEHSMSLMVELADQLPWSLCVGHDEVSEAPNPEQHFGSEEFTAIPMSAGDGVMYQGVTHRHGRIDPNPNRWSAHLFLHWVDANGPHAGEAFDRPALEKAGIR
jgi:hypothetical protein